MTRLRREVSFVDPIPMAPIGTIGSHCRPVLRIDIKGFQCFDHCLTEGHLRGTPWSLVGKPRREQTSGQTIKGHAADMSKPSQLELTAGDNNQYTVYILRSTHDLHIPYLGTFFSHGTPVWPWPVIRIETELGLDSCHVPCVV